MKLKMEIVFLVFLIQVRVYFLSTVGLTHFSFTLPPSLSPCSIALALMFWITRQHNMWSNRERYVLNTHVQWVIQDLAEGGIQPDDGRSPSSERCLPLKIFASIGWARCRMVLHVMLDLDWIFDQELLLLSNDFYYFLFLGLVFIF